MNLVLIRHGESEWNNLNLFTGWTDVDLTKKGIEEAKNAGQLLKKEGFDFDVAYTSYLKRAIHTLNNVLEQMDLEYIPVIKSWNLNERHYGGLQGLNKAETAKKYGQEQVKIWRRSYSVKPLELKKDDFRNPNNQKQYRKINEELPTGESLEDTIKRVVPYFEKFIKKDMLNNKKVIIVAHGNSLRALVKHLEKLSEDEIMEVNIPTAVPLVYELDKNFNVLSKRYLGNNDEIASKIKSVENQSQMR